MIPGLNQNGLLPEGIHKTNWEQIVQYFGKTEYRLKLLYGMKIALIALKDAGCKRVYIDGSFVTDKEFPEDYDGCWDPSGVDPVKLDPVLLDFSNRRNAMKAKYYGELFISTSKANTTGDTFLDFFQIDKETGLPKGILVINLERFKYD